jgi:hypothetical protein
MYGYVSPVNSVFSHRPQIWNYPLHVNGFSAIDIEDAWYFPRSDANRNKKRQFALGVGYDVTLKGQSTISYELDYIKASHSADLRNVRFSDAIDPQRGFVAPSRYGNGEIAYSYNNIAFQATYQFVQNLNPIKTTHALGIGVRFNYVYNSAYYILTTDAFNSNQNVAFFDNDLSTRDFSAGISPFVRYRIKVFHRKNTAVWVKADYHYAIQTAPMSLRKNYDKKPSVNVLLIGFEFHRDKLTKA